MRIDYAGMGEDLWAMAQRAYRAGELAKHSFGARLRLFNLGYACKLFAIELEARINN